MDLTGEKVDFKKEYKKGEFLNSGITFNEIKEKVSDLKKENKSLKINNERLKAYNEFVSSGSRKRMLELEIVKAQKDKIFTVNEELLNEIDMLEDNVNSLHNENISLEKQLEFFKDLYINLFIKYKGVKKDGCK